jgi:hypothetical protein
MRSPRGSIRSSCGPIATVQQYLAKAQREQNAESEFSQRESSHFVLHYEGKQTSDVFREQILAALESDYDDLARDLGTPPHDNILVTLYTEQAFFRRYTRAFVVGSDQRWQVAHSDQRAEFFNAGTGAHSQA